MHDSSTCPICRSLPLDGAMSDEEFFAFLDGCRDELAEKQTRFQQRIAGEAQWSIEMADCSLTLGAQCFHIIPVGTHSSEHETWLWAWANEDFPTKSREASKELQALHALTGFQVFLDPGIAATKLDAQDFSAMAVHQLGAIGIFRTVSNGLTLYLAVGEPKSVNGV